MEGYVLQVRCRANETYNGTHTSKGSKRYTTGTPSWTASPWRTAWPWPSLLMVGTAQPSVCCKTVEPPCASRTLQGWLTAPGRGVRGIPRGVAAAVAVVVAYLSAPLGIARPVVAGVIHLVGGIGGPVFLGPRQHVVLIGVVTTALHKVAMFVESGPLHNIRVEMQLVEIGGDQFAQGIVPRTNANAVPRGDAPRARGFRTEIGTPRAMTDTRGVSERLAVGIGACQAPEIRAIPSTSTGDKKAHRVSLRKSHGGAEQQ